MSSFSPFRSRGTGVVLSAMFLSGLIAFNPGCPSDTGDETSSPCVEVEIADNGQFPPADEQFAFIGNHQYREFGKGE